MESRTISSVTNGRPSDHLINAGRRGGSEDTAGTATPPRTTYRDDLQIPERDDFDDERITRGAREPSGSISAKLVDELMKFAKSVNGDAEQIIESF